MAVKAYMIMKIYTLKQIEEWKEKAEKWDALDNEIGKYYTCEDEDNEEDYDDEGSLLDIGETAAIAFGYL